MLVKYISVYKRSIYVYVLQGVLHPCRMYTLGAVCRAWRRIVFHGGYQIRKCLYCEYLMCILEQIEYIIIPVDKGIECP